MTANPKILIYNFTLRRDTAGSLVLKNLLELRGGRVVLACGRNFERYLKFWNPDIVVINTISRLANVKAFAPRARIVLWPGEGGEPDFSSNARMLSARGGDYDDISLILAWGEYDKKLFETYFPGKTDKVIVCGNPKLDLVKFNPFLKTRKAEARSIGFIGRFNSINHYDGRPAIYSLNNPDNLPSVIAQAKGYVTMVKVVDYLIENTDYPVSIRPHPLEAPENYVYLQKKYKDRLSIDDSIDLAYWVAGQSFILSPSSTSFLEAYLGGTPIVNIEALFDGLSRTQYAQPFAALSAKAGLVPESFEQLAQIITRPHSPAKVEEIERHLDEVHAYNMPGSACMRAAQAIIPQSVPPANISWMQAMLGALDWISFQRNCIKNRLHPNFNYQPLYHATPPYFQMIVNEIAGE